MGACVSSEGRAEAQAPLAAALADSWAPSPAPSKGFPARGKLAFEACSYVDEWPRLSPHDWDDMVAIEVRGREGAQAPQGAPFRRRAATPVAAARGTAYPLRCLSRD